MTCYNHKNVLKLSILRLKYLIFYLLLQSYNDFLCESNDKLS